MIWKSNQIFNKSDSWGDVSQEASPFRFVGQLYFIQLQILLLRQAQPNATTPHLDPITQHLVRLTSRQPSATLCHFDNLLRTIQVQFPGEGGFQIGFQKLAISALTLHEVHINAPAWRMGWRAALTGTFARTLRRTKPLLTPAANLSRQQSPCRRSSFSADGKNCTSIFAFYSPQSSMAPILHPIEGRMKNENEPVVGGRGGRGYGSSRSSEKPQLQASERRRALQRTRCDTLRIEGTPDGGGWPECFAH
jgi:hypothetical protein